MRVSREVSWGPWMRRRAQCKRRAGYAREPRSPVICVKNQGDATFRHTPVRTRRWPSVPGVLRGNPCARRWPQGRHRGVRRTQRSALESTPGNEARPHTATPSGAARTPHVTSAHGAATPRNRLQPGGRFPCRRRRHICVALPRNQSIAPKHCRSGQALCPYTNDASRQPDPVRSSGGTGTMRETSHGLVYARPHLHQRHDPIIITGEGAANAHDGQRPCTEDCHDR